MQHEYGHAAIPRGKERFRRQLVAAENTGARDGGYGG
jgi:hypothetical protein